jgi:hypothetical protein
MPKYCWIQCCESSPVLDQIRIQPFDSDQTGSYVVNYNCLFLARSAKKVRIRFSNTDPTNLSSLRCHVKTTEKRGAADLSDWWKCP